MKISPSAHHAAKRALASLKTQRSPWWAYWRELAQYYSPVRFTSLMSANELSSRATNRNTSILDATGTLAAKTLAAGMMNGITSPARPWFKLRPVNFEDYLDRDARIWLDDSERRMLRVMGESNFYNCLAVLYFDLSIFATAAMPIYEDDEKVIHCENLTAGEYYLMVDAQHRVCGFAREFIYNVYQLVMKFGEENVGLEVLNKYKAGGEQLYHQYIVVHFVEPNDQREASLELSFAYRERYWLASASDGDILSERGYFELPGIFPRWEVAGNDPYGTGPAMDALGDVIQLQHMTKRKAQGVDKLVSPPILADTMLEHKPTALLPNGITYVPRLGDTSGARPIYTVNPPLNDMTGDIMRMQERIRQHFHNELFNRVLTLQTVRSAEEIRSIDSEQLVLLGPVLHRFNNEALDPAIERIFGIMRRRNMFLPIPASLRGRDLRIQYVSIFASAQNAVTTAPTERGLQVLGNLAPVFPEVKFVPNIPKLLPQYLRDIGWRAEDINPAEAIEAGIAQANGQNAQTQQLDQATVAAQGAKLLSETEVGGGANALQRLLEGA